MEQGKAIQKNQIDSEILGLADEIEKVVAVSKQNLIQNINSALVQTNWMIGRYIVEFEQKGDARAKYGTNMLSSLSKVLTAKLGRGYSRPNLNNMRKFYLLYPKC